MVAIAERTLPRLAEEIKEHHDACAASLGDALSRARVAGEKLIEAKSVVAHGQFQTFVEDSCGLSPRTGRTYMAIARNWPLIESQNGPNSTVLSIDQARRLIAGQKPKPDTGEWDWRTDPELQRLTDEIHLIIASMVARFREAGRGLIEVRSEFDKAGIRHRFLDWCEKECRMEQDEAECLIALAEPGLSDADVFRMHEAFIDRRITESVS